MRISQYRIEGLGHLSTLLADEEAGLAAVVDPRRDVDLYLAAAATAGLRISHVVETHLHNDYVSGASDLAGLTGAVHVIGAAAELRTEHHPIRDGDVFDVGSLRFTARETPGHTPEHVTYAVADRSRADEPLVLLTGGSLLVGAVGRTDLLGPEQALSSAHAMYRSLHNVILRHEDYVTIYPTHGAGSLCSAGISSTPWSTIGYERRHDALLAVTDIDAFAEQLLRGQPTFPRYFARMRPLNQAGPPPMAGRVPTVAPLTPEAVAHSIAGGALLVDARPAAVHAAGHPPGSLSIPAGSSFGTWLGWVIPADRPLVLLVEEPSLIDDLARQAMRIGCDAITGYLQGGLARWAREGRPVQAGGRLSTAELASRLAGDPASAPFVIDVRQPSEFEAGHLPGARHINAGSLADRLAELPRERSIATICATGYRASIAASLLQAAGFDDVAWVAEGVPAWRASGYPVETGSVESEEVISAVR
ncbi:MAG: rhodanese-like domain-containing protein [Candidatus Limnocylindrales bacterium]